MNKQLAELQELVANTTNPILNESSRTKQHIEQNTDGNLQQAALERNQDQLSTKEQPSLQSSTTSALCLVAEIFHLKSTTVESLKTCNLGDIEVTPKQILDLFNL
ncbi:hypothetical protein PV10_07747 [Exophiala mesophila]|uniref:Uncharacterized protein n=1 Tax=Exophiala mesophila TaxID=212818 RepID=A0A0D1WN33_EXOME|nr:uncharacterized protein PV10_07747 [Exophiala mesophila]KIV90440.1 hypothetical protein PV10_07747 [Exophiala mesophila]